MTPVVLMCGGKGERLHALTRHTPKPMLPVGDKPMIESLIETFRDQGFRKFWLCVHYKAEMIEGYFGNGSRWGVKIGYTHEKEPLGTAGALRLLPKFNVPFIVQNADILTRISYGELMTHHGQSNAPATMCLALHQHQIEFGVADVEDGRLVRIREKPIENYYVNAGIYVLDPKALEQLPPEGPCDMPDLIGKLDPVSAYPIHDYWRDLGRFEDLERARQEWRG